MTDTINFTYDKYEKFKKAYKQAIEDNKTDFFFEGHQFLTSYGKYLLEHLDKKNDIKRM
jgi:hypothetical protein